MKTAFEHALEARLLWMQVRSYGALGYHRLAKASAREAYRVVEMLAMHEARSTSPRYSKNCPMMFSDVSKLACLYEHAWRDEVQEIEDEREEEAEYLRYEQAKAHALSCIAREDWEALELPSPELLSAELYAGKPMRVDGHFLDYEDGIVWMDNPYGVEGCLGEEPTIQLCREFLITIAKGGMYGPEP